MKTYLVRKEDIVSYCYEVKADSPEEAEDKVLDKDYNLGESDNKLYYIPESWSSGTKLKTVEI